jgi:hypothetical protein
MRIFMRVISAMLAIAWSILAVAKDEVAPFVCRLLRHREFDTIAKRMGTVVRVSHVDLSVWRLHAEQAIHIAWNMSRQ